MLSQNMTDKIIDYIMSHGGDFAEVFAEHTRRNQLAMTGGNMSEALAGVESGVGIRIFSGDQCAYFYTEDEREENLFRLLKKTGKQGNQSDRTGRSCLQIRKYMTARQNISKVLLSKIR